MLAKVGPSTVAFVVAEGVNTNAEEEGDGEPNQGAPGTVEVLGVPDASFKPSSDLVERPHGGDEHGTGVPALGHHAGDDECHHAGQERTPVANVAVVADFGGDTELVEGLHAVEMPK